MNKGELRNKYLKLRKEIVSKDIKSSKIFNKIICIEEFASAKIIALYKSLSDEVNTEKIIKYCIDNNKIVVLPRVVGNELIFYKISSADEKFEKSNFGVLEPIDNKSNIVNANKINLIIVPGICFDKNKNRVGFGKGYYDRFLRKTKLRSIAICFEEQILKKR